MKSKGFTLLECLLSLMILGLSVLLINGIIRQMPQVNQQLLLAKRPRMADIFDSVRKGASNVYVCFSESVYTFLKAAKKM